MLRGTVLSSPEPPPLILHGTLSGLSLPLSVRPGSAVFSLITVSLRGGRRLGHTAQWNRQPKNCEAKDRRSQQTTSLSLSPHFAPGFCLWLSARFLRNAACHQVCCRKCYKGIKKPPRRTGVFGLGSARQRTQLFSDRSLVLQD